jgi:hypothetical protein
MNDKQAVDQILKIWTKVSKLFSSSDDPISEMNWGIQDRWGNQEQTHEFVQEDLIPFLTDWEFISKHAERLKGNRKLRISPFVTRGAFGMKDYVVTFPEGKTREVCFVAVSEIILASLLARYPACIAQTIQLLEEEESAEYLANAFLWMRVSFSSESYWIGYKEVRQRFFEKYGSKEIRPDTRMILALWRVAPPIRDIASQLEMADQIDQYMMNRGLPYVGNRDLDAWSRGSAGIVRHEATKNYLNEDYAAQAMISIWVIVDDLEGFLNSPMSWNMSEPGDEINERRSGMKNIWLYAKEFGIHHWVDNWSFIERKAEVLRIDPRLAGDSPSGFTPFEEVAGLLIAMAVIENGATLASFSECVDSAAGISMLWSIYWVCLDCGVPFGDVHSRRVLADKLDKRIKRLELDDESEEYALWQELLFDRNQ